MQIETNVRCWQIVLQKSFCGMGLKFSEAWARRLNNDVGDHVGTRQTHRRFWQRRVCGAIGRGLSLFLFFCGEFAAAAFWAFFNISAPKGPAAYGGDVRMRGGAATRRPR